MALAKGMANPGSLDKGFISAGKEIFSGKGRCAMCHGETGKGDSPMAAAFNPKPRDLQTSSGRRSEQTERYSGQSAKAQTMG